MRNLIIAVVAGCVIGSVGTWGATSSHYKKVIADYERESTIALRLAEAKTDALQVSHDQIAQNYEQEKKTNEKVISDLRSRIASGAVRLSVKTTGSQCVSNDSRTGATETRAELDRQTADALVGIASDGDNAIRELNQCIDSYNSVYYASLKK